MQALGSVHKPPMQHEQLKVPWLGTVPGGQRAQAVTFTLLQLEGWGVVGSGAADGTPGGVVTPGGDTGALLDVAVSPVDA